MKDRFKFRVWDKPLEKYMEFKEFKLMNVEFTFNPITKEAEIEYDKERYIVEQCTGLKDKNGKLIYENDYVKISSNTDREVISPVVWDDDETGFCIKYKEELFRFNPYREYHKLEIIGNIHEKAGQSK